MGEPPLRGGIVRLARIAGVVAGALAATVLVAAPSGAAEFGSLDCSAESAVSQDVTVDLALTGLAEGETTTVWVEIQAGGYYDNSPYVVGASWQHVFEDAFARAAIKSTAYITVDVGGVDHQCTVAWSAVVTAPLSLPASVAAGSAVTIKGHVDSLVDVSTLDMLLEYNDAGIWKIWSRKNITVAGNTSFTVTPPRWREVRLVIVEDGGEDDYAAVRGASSILNAVVAAPTLASKPTKILQGKTVKAVVHYGGYTTAGTATLQRKTSAGAWVAVKKVALTQGVATLSWTASATYSYRVAVAQTGKAAKYTTSFKVTYTPRLKLTAPATVKKNATVTFALTNNIAPPFYAYLQRWSGSKWVTVKTFVPGEGVNKVTAKVTATSKWRVSAAGYVSKTITVKVT